MHVRGVIPMIQLACFCCLATHMASAEDATFPARPVSIVMPLPPGAAPDVRIRIIAEHMSTVLKQRVFVENKPGAGGLIGAQAVLAAPADAHTLFAAPSSVFTILPAQRDKLPFDLNRDFVPIGLIASEPMILAVSSRLGVADLRGFLDLAKTKPESIVIGTNPTGSLPNLTAKLLSARSKAPIVVLPYSSGGSAETIRDLVGGRVHAIIETMTALRPFIASNDLKPIASFSDERLAAMPALPAATETIPGLTAVGWVALFASRAAPEIAVRRIGEALEVTLADPGIKHRLNELGTPFQPIYGPDLAAFIARDQALWLPIARQP